MKKKCNKILGIIVLSLLLSGNTFAQKDTTVVLDCTSKSSNNKELVIINLKKNIMKFYEWTYTIDSISETYIDANNLDRLPSSGALKHYLSFNRYTGHLNITWFYSDGEVHSNYKYICKIAKKII